MADTTVDGAAPTRTGANARPDYLASLKLLTRHIAGSRNRMCGAVVLAIIAVGFEMIPILSAHQAAVAAVRGTLDAAGAAEWALIALTGVILGYAAMGAAIGASHIVAFDVIRRLRFSLARHLARLPLGWFSRLPAGEARKLIVDEPESMELIFAHGIPEGASALATWIAVSVWLFVVDWRMALAAVAVTPVAFVLMTLAMTRGAAHAAEYQRTSERMNGAILEFLTGMPVVKIFNREGESLAQTARAVRDHSDLETRWARDFLPLGGTFHALVLANVVVIIPTGAWLIAAGSLDLPTLILFVILGANYSAPLMKLFNQFHTLAHISMASTRVEETLTASVQPDTRAEIAFPRHDVCFENVSFGYDGRDVLRDVSLTAREGTVTALVGPSGSGKTTIASLIPRFWDVERGRITVGGVDVREVGLERLMDAVAFVFQDTFLFADTIAANIRFGKSDATDAEVEAAARAARAHDFIAALPDGYQTKLGERGAALSGGERQRLAIARAVLKAAPIVVLDEATAFADPDNEAAIQEAIGALTAGRTLIVVAHRLHTIVSADQILVVDKGRIAERGRHEDLLKLNGTYARLWRDHEAARATTLRARIEGEAK